MASSGPNLIGHLEARGVKAKRISEWASTGDPTAPEALVAHFDTQDTDLIVAGASDLRGVTKGLFSGATLDLMHRQSPALISHWRPVKRQECKVLGIAKDLSTCNESTIASNHGEREFFPLRGPPESMSAAGTGAGARFDAFNDKPQRPPASPAAMRKYFCIAQTKN